VSSWKTLVEERQTQRQMTIDRFCREVRANQRPRIPSGRAAVFTLFSHQFKYVAYIRLIADVNVARIQTLSSKPLVSLSSAYVEIYLYLVSNLDKRRLGTRCLTDFVTQSWVSTLSSVNWRHTFYEILTTKRTKRIRDFCLSMRYINLHFTYLLTLQLQQFSLIDWYVNMKH